MERTPITVAQLNNYIKTLIGSDRALSDVLVAGEISSFKFHSATGHLYFDIKDQTSSIRVVMFNSDAKGLSFKPEDGMKVIIKGRIGVFEKAGTYQIYARSMEPDGLGSLYLEFLKLKEKLEKQGLFDQSRKRTPKRLPKVIAVITSKSGAVIRDIENVLTRRYPLCKIVLFPATVQGDEAPESIVRAFGLVNETEGIDTVILARGGGSQLDLWCFNDERVALAISSCRYPVISAVGHETDFTIADFVADRRAPTPSAAAEVAAADIADILKYIETEKRRMNAALMEKLSAEENKIKTVMNYPLFRSPDEFLAEKSTEVVYLTERILRTKNISELMKTKTDSVVMRINSGYKELLGATERAFIEKISKIKAMDPLNVLSRGFAAVEKEGKIIADVNDINISDKITVKMRNGSLEAIVTERRKENE